jgi:hypothetical protein
VLVPAQRASVTNDEHCLLLEILSLSLELPQVLPRSH